MKYWGEEMQQPPSRTPEFVAGLIVCLVILVIMICGTIREHPRSQCVAWEPGTCGGGVYCVAYDPDLNCVMWQTEKKHPCQVCVQMRQP